MATKGAIDLYVNSLPSEIRYPVQRALWYIMDNWRVGTGARAENGQLYRFTSTSAAVANTEFAITHGVGITPTQLFPVLDLSALNSQMIPLTVSRVADASRIYLKSSSTSAVFTILAEF